jgi:hypothetical protein
MLNSHARAFDTRLEHRAAGSAALTADTTIDTHTQRAKTRTEYVTMLRVESIKISANNEEYRFIFEVSNDGFSTVETAAILSLGATEVRLGGGPDNAAGDEYQVPWFTEVNGQSYKDWRVRLDVAGTSPSIAFSMNSAC